MTETKIIYDQVKLMEPFGAAALQYLDRIMEFSAPMNDEEALDHPHQLERAR